VSKCLFWDKIDPTTCTSVIVQMKKWFIQAFKCCGWQIQNGRMQELCHVMFTKLTHLSKQNMQLFRPIKFGEKFIRCFPCFPFYARRLLSHIYAGQSVFKVEELTLNQILLKL